MAPVNHSNRKQARIEPRAKFARSAQTSYLGAPMLALLLVAALAAGTIALAHRLERLGDTLVVIGASVLGGLVFLLAHPEMSLIAPPRDDADQSCDADLPAEEPQAQTRVDRVTVADARELLERSDVTFVDARPASAYAYAHIPGAMNLPAADAEGLLELQSLPIPPEGQVITYCDGGRCEQSDYLGTLLAERDVCQQVRVLEGGWQAWITAEGPMVSGTGRFGDGGGASSMSSSETPGEVQP